MTKVLREALEVYRGCSVCGQRPKVDRFKGESLTCAHAPEAKAQIISLQRFTQIRRAAE